MSGPTHVQACNPYKGFLTIAYSNCKTIVMYLNYILECLLFKLFSYIFFYVQLLFVVFLFLIAPNIKREYQKYFTIFHMSQTSKNFSEPFLELQTNNENSHFFFKKIKNQLKHFPAKKYFTPKQTGLNYVSYRIFLSLFLFLTPKNGADCNCVLFFE